MSLGFEVAIHWSRPKIKGKWFVPCMDVRVEEGMEDDEIFYPEY